MAVVSDTTSDPQKGGPMNRMLNRSVMIIIALLLSIGFTGTTPLARPSETVGESKNRRR